LRGRHGADAARIARMSAAVRPRRHAEARKKAARAASPRFCRRTAETLLERAVERRLANEPDRTGNRADEIARVQRRLEPAHGFIEPASPHIFGDAAHRFKEFVKRRSGYFQDFAQPRRAEARVR